MEGLKDLHRTIDQATELLAAFVSLARSNELPPANIVELADQVTQDLAEWRAELAKLPLGPRH